jgi:hypothetical protein
LNEYSVFGFLKWPNLKEKPLRSVAVWMIKAEVFAIAVLGASLAIFRYTVDATFISIAAGDYRWLRVIGFIAIATCAVASFCLIGSAIVALVVIPLVSLCTLGFYRWPSRYKRLNDRREQHLAYEEEQRAWRIRARARTPEQDPPTERRYRI